MWAFCAVGLKFMHFCTVGFFQSCSGVNGSFVTHSVTSFDILFSLKLESSSYSTMLFSVLLQCLNVFVVYLLQDYLNVKFKETGHSNMYFPQVRKPWPICF